MHVCTVYDSTNSELNNALAVVLVVQYRGSNEAITLLVGAQAHDQ